MMKRALGIVLVTLLVASCQGDRQAGGVTDVVRTAPQTGAFGSAEVIAPPPCDRCVFGPATFVRDRGAPVSDTIHFNAVAGMLYVVDADEVGSQGAVATVELNGTVLMAPGSASADSGSEHVTRTMTLGLVNTLVVRLMGKPGSLFRIAVWPFKKVTLDGVTLAAGTNLQLEGPSQNYTATITNHTASTFTDIALQAWLLQPSGRRAAGGMLVSCGAGMAVVPPGTCTGTGSGILASNTLEGFGTLIPGNALAVIQVLGLSGAGVLDSLIVPVVLLPPPGPTVLSVTVRPASVLLKIGDQAQLTADVQALGGAPTTVSWSTSNPSVAVVSPSGVVTGVGLAQTVSPYVTIIARSTGDPTKADSAQVAVVDWRMVSPEASTFVSTGSILPAANPLSVQLKAEMCVTSAVAGTPFTRVDFFALSGGSPVMIGSNSSPVVIQAGASRCIQWWLTWAPGTTFGVGVQTVYAVGVDAAGATVATALNTTITTTSP